MIEPSSEHRFPALVIHKDFVETAFEQRFQGLLRHAWKSRSWHVIAAVPGSGKSLGIHDIVLHSGACKYSNGTTSLPILALRAPKNGAKEQALGMAMSAALGVTPNLTWYVRRSWLVQAVASAQVECIIIDDAQDLELAHLAFLKELTDNLAAPPYERQVSLCLVTAHSGNIIPFKEVFARPDTLWRQFRRRLDTERPFCVVLGHTQEEVSNILTTFEDLYRSQIPDLQLRCWTKSIYTWLTQPTLDPDATGRVTMDHVTRLITSALHRAYEQGATDINATILQEIAEMMILRHHEITPIDGIPSQVSFPAREVG
jgi:hypothetical protein